MPQDLTVEALLHPLLPTKVLYRQLYLSQKPVSFGRETWTKPIYIYFVLTILHFQIFNWWFKLFALIVYLFCFRHRMLPEDKFIIVMGFHILLRQPEGILSHIWVFTSSMLTNVFSCQMDFALVVFSELPS